jgi:hypothetical protein
MAAVNGLADMNEARFVVSLLMTSAERHRAKEVYDSQRAYCERFPRRRSFRVETETQVSERCAPFWGRPVLN